ncbi:hypothetical protein Agub_g1561 [Astrephomene gubernaculifera]|uniref:Uncharacterized protein n=1 Tax=Astrephomene gubernaculifera TaxID=47775 RepID=A0AAD3DJ44_9CHLO|nr:hypothetical protein Agub_g1561 [Astrephomene gubernaculifera]
MQKSLESSSSVDYVAVKPRGLVESQVVDMFNQYQRDLKKREIMDHIHNIKSKAQGACFDEFIQSVIANLQSPSYVQLVMGCSTFTAFAEILSTVHKEKRDAIMIACKGFCEKYKLELKFWEQASAVEQLNGDRNAVAHCDIAVSADAIIQAAKVGQLPEVEEAWAMLGALANYGKMNKVALEDASRKERQKRVLLSEQYRQRLTQA